MHSPSDPRWEPDPTGQRLVTIRAARRGAVLAALIFGSIVAVAVWGLFPPEGVGAPPSAGVLVALMSLPGLALLGAGLTPAALGSRVSAASAGVALGLGAPVFSVASSMFAVWIVIGRSSTTRSRGTWRVGCCGTASRSRCGSRHSLPRGVPRGCGWCAVGSA